MMADVPVHASLSGLLLLLPFAWLWWRSVAARYTAEPSIASALTVGLLLFANVFVTHVVGLLTQSFYAGLIFAIVGPGLLGLTVWFRSRRSPRPPRTARAPRDLKYAAALAFALVAMAPGVIFFDYHDLLDSTGHLATASQIMNGIYPPRSMSSADRLWIYHYAVDQLFASVTALLRIPLNLAIDLTTLALWLYTAHLFGLLCRLIFGRPYDSLGVLVGCFSGGLPWLASFDFPSSFNDLLGNYGYAGYWGSPPAVSNFLQYPWTLGLPLILFAFLMFQVELDRESPDTAGRRLGLAMIGLALLTLSVAQTAGFVALYTAVAVWVLWSAVRDPRQGRDLLLGLGALILSIGAVLPLLGGMIGPLVSASEHDWLARVGVLEAPTGLLESHMRFWRPVPLLDKLRWNIASFGLLPLGLLCLLTRWKPATRSLLKLMAILFAVSFLAMNLFYYEESWDIVKFAFAGSISLTVMSVGAIQAAFGRALRATRARRRLALGGVATWLALLLTPGLLYQAGVIAAAVVAPEPKIPVPALWRMNWQATTISDGDAAAIRWLRRHIQPGEMVLCGNRLQQACAILGGFPQPAFDTAGHFGWGERERLRRLELPKARTSQQFQAIDVCWAIDASPSRLDWNPSQVRFASKGSPEVARCSDPASRSGIPCDPPAVLRLCPDAPDGAG
jgi:hypothetical protein